jgi:hypothetical protein
MKNKFVVVGFPKCGTMSMVEWLKKKNPKCIVERPENIYKEQNHLHVVKKWYEWECIAITRDPVKRIQSGIKYFEELRNMPVEKVCGGPFTGIQKFENVGFRWPIYQSNYDFFIKKWERYHGARIKVYRFEDMIKDKDFPHINESTHKRKLEGDRLYQR